MSSEESSSPSGPNWSRIAVGAVAAVAGIFLSQQLWKKVKQTRSQSSDEAKSKSTALTKEQLASYEKNGYLVIPDFSTPEECLEMEKQIGVILEDFHPGEKHSVFSADSQKRDLEDDYFLTSGDKIRFFLEEKAFNEDGTYKQHKDLSVNKIGHALHELDPVFKKFTHTKLKDLASSIGFRKPALLQGMFIFKQPRIGGEVNVHQDSTFLYTEPQSCVGFWLPIHDTTLENGCLWAVPGSHKDPKYKDVSQRMVRSPSGGGTVFITMPGKEGVKLPELPIDDAVALPIKKGSLVLIHGSVIHFSYENTSDKPRHAYTVHMIETDNTEYPKDNWLQNPNYEPFPGFE